MGQELVDGLGLADLQECDLKHTFVYINLFKYTSILISFLISIYVAILGDIISSTFELHCCT